MVRGGPFFTAHDAVETAIVDSLATANQKLASEAWLVVRQQVREFVLAGVDDIWILMSTTGYSHAVADGPLAGATLAASAGEAYYIISVGQRVRTARDRFEAEVEKLARRPSVSDARQERQ